MIVALRSHLQYCRDVTERLNRRTRELIRQSVVRRDVSEIALVESEMRIRRHVRRREAKTTGRRPGTPRRSPQVAADDLVRLLDRRSSDYLCAVCLALQIGGSLSQTLDRLSLLVGAGAIRSTTGPCQCCCARTRATFGDHTDFRRHY